MLLCGPIVSHKIFVMLQEITKTRDTKEIHVIRLFGASHKVDLAALRGSAWHESILHSKLLFKIKMKNGEAKSLKH